MKIYIVEDEETIRIELHKLLKKYGYICQSNKNFENVTKDILEANPELILLDINLPYKDGYTICKEVRKSSDIPIIVLTSRHTDFDELLSFNIGADDFIAKPYNAQILIARIQKLFKRIYDAGSNSTLNHKGLSVSLLKATMVHNGVEIDLTKNELGILRLLVVNKGNIIPRDAIIDELWQNKEFIDENTLNVNIVRLRKKLAQIGLPGYLETKRGLGYRV